MTNECTGVEVNTLGYVRGKMKLAAEYFSQKSQDQVEERKSLVDKMVKEQLAYNIAMAKTEYEANKALTNQTVMNNHLVNGIPSSNNPQWQVGFDPSQQTHLNGLATWEVKPYQQPYDINYYPKEASGFNSGGINWGFTTQSIDDQIAGLYTLQEKIDFLKSLGYEVANGVADKLDKRDDDLKVISLAPKSIEETFKFEIMIKFKNMLLTKGTLKIKI